MKSGTNSTFAMMFTMTSYSPCSQKRIAKTARNGSDVNACFAIFCKTTRCVFAAATPVCILEERAAETCNALTRVKKRKEAPKDEDDDKVERTDFKRSTNL